jgi:hypothetical protein
MARNTATLAINIISDASGASRGLDEATSKVDKFKSGLDKASLAATGVLAGLAGLGKQAFDAASDLQQTTGSINAVFGDWALDIEQTAQTAAKGVGLSTSQYEQMAAVIGSQLKNAGMTAGDATAKTQALISTGADMAAVFGGTAADAVEALSSALKGEMDPIEKYGVSLNQSAIDAQKAADGNAGLTGAADKAAQTQAILEQITAQTSQTTGQWADQAGTAAEQTQIAGAAAENAAAKLGDVLLPVVGWLADKLAAMAGWAAQNKTTVQILVGVLGGLAAVVLTVNAAVSAYEAIARIAAAAQWLWNVAMDANPIGLIVLAVAAVIAGIVLLINHFGGFQAVVQATGQVFSTIWNAILGAIGWVWDKIQALGGAFSTVFGWIAKVMQPVTDVIKWIADKIAWVIDKARAVGNFFGNLFSAPAPAPAAGPAGGQRGLLGAPAGLRAAGLLTAGGGIGSSPSGAAPGLGTTVNITVNGALDPVAVGKQIQGVLRDYTRRTGQQVAVAR